MNQKSITLIVNDTIIDKMKWEGMPILYDKSFDIINIDDNDKIKQSINSSSLTPGMFAFRNPYKDNSFIAVRQASELHSIKTQLVSNFFATLGAKSVYLEQISIQEGTQTHTFSRTKDNTEKLTFNVNKNNGIFRKSNDATGGFSTSKTTNTSKDSHENYFDMERYVINNTYKGMDFDYQKSYNFLKSNNLDEDESLVNQLKSFEYGIFPSELSFEVSLENRISQSLSNMKDISEKYSLDVDFKIPYIISSLQGQYQDNVKSKESILKKLDQKYCSTLRVTF